MNFKTKLLCELSQKIGLSVILIVLCVILKQNNEILNKVNNEKCVINEYFIEKESIETVSYEMEGDFNDYTAILSQLTSEEWEILYKVATAEAGYNSREAQQNVIKVVLNRVFDDRFPNSIEEVVYEEGQFQVVSNGYIDMVDITDFTKMNVQDAFLDFNLEVDNAEDALFFTTGKFDRTYLFTDEVGHNFYK